MKNPKTAKENTKSSNISAARDHGTRSSAGVKLLARHHPRPCPYLPRKNLEAPARRSDPFLSDHAPLQAHVYRLRAVGTGTCPHCDDTPETVVHRLLRCQTFAAKRHQHLTSRGLEFLNQSFLLSSSEALLPPLRFIKASSQFSDLNNQSSFVSCGLGSLVSSPFTQSQTEVSLRIAVHFRSSR